MDELQDTLHKFEKASADLRAATEKMNPSDPRSVRITLVVAKRVRTTSNLLVRALARTRDNLHSQEADNKS